MNKFACVTGADRGLGLEIVKQLVARDFTVFAGKYLLKWNLLESFEHPDKVYIVEIDVADDDSVKKAAQFILSKTEYLDILVNNAGMPGKRETGGTIFDELDFDNMLHVYNVNALGAIRMTNALIKPIMASFHKLIVNISSEAGSISTCWRYKGFAYCMSKAALNMSSAIIHNSLHREFNGQVMDFNPGGMPTHFSTQKSADDEMLPPVERQGFTSAEKSAEGIVNHMLEQERFKSDHPAFISYGGNVIPW